jgi:hypothetical protein
MTAIVGIATKDGVIIGGDSAGVGGLSLTIRKDPKVFVRGAFAYGFTDSFRMGQLLHYSFNPPDHDPRVDVDKYLRTVWLDELRKTFERGGYTYKDGGRENGGRFLVGYQSRLFYVGGDFQVGEAACGYDAEGCGDDLAKGALYALKSSKLSAEKKVLLALEASEAHSAGVRRPFHVVKTKGMK